MKLQQMKRLTGVLVYAGPSYIDDKPIICVATLKTENRKTGDMIQTWIIRSDLSPLDAHKAGDDYSVCGNCKHRGTEALGIGSGKRTCYVNLGQAPRQVYKQYTLGRYPKIFQPDYRRVVLNRYVRLGAYGDPAALPFEILSDFVQSSKGHTGYTHQWRDCDQRWRSLLMASVDSLEEKHEAEDMGWRTFRCMTEQESLESNEIFCPAAPEGGSKTDCANCRLCAGNKHSKSVKSIGIIVHGPTATTFQKEFKDAS